MRQHLLVLLFAAAAGCSSSDPDGAASAESEVNGDAKIVFSSDFASNVTGTPRAGKGLVVEYALERLPQCRGDVGGGGPGWNVTGYYSENGGPAKIFEVSAVESGERVAKPARIALGAGGDLALWFQVSNRWGCSEFDSAFGNNFHLDVEGPAPEADGKILFKKNGDVEQSGALRAGGKVAVRYEQDRLPQCRRQQNGMPQWNISGYASINGAEKQTFSTGRPDGADRAEIDAILDLPRSGELALWFDVVSLGGCHEFDSAGGANYRFRIED